MEKCPFHDAFEKARLEKGLGNMDDQNDPVTMVLRFKDVKECAENHQTFQSGATPGRIVVPSEVNIRDTRQIPFEVDPPLHGEYRALLEDWFRRPFQPEYDQALFEQIDKLVLEMVQRDKPLEVVKEFALPLQSRALTLLLNIPLEESAVWIGWGTHVFRSDDNPLDGSKASILYDYIDEQITKAIEQPGEDLYSTLLATDFQGRKLTREEVKGIMILTFAGGRDTIINSVTNTIAYFAENPASLQRIREEPRLAHKATEELIRYFSPLTHMGRVVTEDTQICGEAIKKDSRISLCWASANRDETVFENPNQVILDRRRNPHIAFGFSHHNCLGAHHARQLLKALLRALAKNVSSITIKDQKEHIEEWGSFNRKVGYHNITVTFNTQS